MDTLFGIGSYPTYHCKECGNASRYFPVVSRKISKQELTDFVDEIEKELGEHLDDLKKLINDLNGT